MFNLMPLMPLKYFQYLLNFISLMVLFFVSPWRRGKGFASVALSFEMFCAFFRVFSALKKEYGNEDDRHNFNYSNKQTNHQLFDSNVNKI